VDDSVDVDDSFADAQRVLSEQKSKRRTSGILRVQDLVPFHFSPNFLPLTVSSLDSCIALENAAFTNPDHRCSPEKVSHLPPGEYVEPNPPRGLSFCNSEFYVIGGGSPDLMFEFASVFGTDIHLVRIPPVTLFRPVFWGLLQRRPRANGRLGA
jgi:hypothetical protein